MNPSNGTHNCRPGGGLRWVRSPTAAHRSQACARLIFILRYRVAPGRCKFNQCPSYSGSPFRIFNIKVFIASGYFDVLNPDGSPTSIQYDIYMSNEVGNGTIGGHSGLNLQANGTPENIRLDKIFNNFFFILKNDDFNYISIISKNQDLIVNCIITDNLF